MELIINIPDEEYNRIKEWEDNITGYQTSLALYRAVRNGIPYEETNTGKDIDIGGSNMTDKIKQAVADEFKYRASHGRAIYTMEEVIYIVNEVIDEVDCSGESKITSTAEVSLDCWENNPILLTSNPPKLVWKCRYCGKEITTEVSEKPTTICNCLKETTVMSQNQSQIWTVPVDVDMQIRIIKGDLNYLAETVNKLLSLLEEHNGEAESHGEHQ